MDSITWPTIEAGIVVALIVAVIIAVIVAAVRYWFQQIRHELVPNSGKSMRDATDRTERAVERIEALVGDHAVKLGVIEERLNTHMQTVALTGAAALLTAATAATAAHDERAAQTAEIIAGQSSS